MLHKQYNSHACKKIEGGQELPFSTSGSTPGRYILLVVLLQFLLLAAVIYWLYGNGSK